MTLAVPKTGLVVEKTRALFLTDIGLPEGAYRQIGVTFPVPWGKRFWIPSAPVRCCAQGEVRLPMSRDQ